MARPKAIPGKVVAFTDCDNRRELHCAQHYSLYVAANSNPHKWIEVQIPEDLAIVIGASIGNWAVAQPAVIENNNVIEMPQGANKVT